MNPLSWLKNLVSTFLGEGRKKELSVVAKVMLEPDHPIDFDLDNTWQRMHTRTRAFADDAWLIDDVDDCEPVWYLRRNDLAPAPLALLYATADELDGDEAARQCERVLTFIAGRLAKYGWSKSDERDLDAGIQQLFTQGEDLRIIETKRRGNGTYLVGVYIPEAARPEGVQVDETGATTESATG